ncbi:unnamed protein product, partial [Didymodactylos carnosus]
MTIETSVTSRKPCGFDVAQSSWKRWPALLLWSWIYPILKLGTKRQLTDDDLSELSPNDKCRQLLNAFESERLKRINTSTLKLIFSTFWREMLVSGLLILPYSVAKIAQPLNTVQWTDKRVKTVNEIVNGCQLVKMYGWEKPLEDVVRNTRENEFKSIRRAGRIRACNMAISFAALPIISLATFGSIWLMGRELTGSQIFTVLSFFSTLRAPLTTFLPLGLERLSEVIISTRRIDDFMNLSKDEDGGKDTDNTHGQDELAGTVLMNKASFCWDAQNQSCLLKDIDLHVKQGSLVGVMGSIGSCKSSLLMAILGEMKLSSGTSRCNGTFAYASQTPWIFADTIRENILFGKPLNPERYAKVLQICCLIPDIDSMAAGDLTVIGEKGVNLSGGQKARVSLARAVYEEADIYLFDDPLAAVDSTVAQSIFEDCIGPDGFLKIKSRILITHQIEYLPKADHCVLLDSGRVKGQGHFNDLLTSAEEVKLLYDLRRAQFDRAAQKRKHVDIVKEEVATESVMKPDEHSIVKEEVSAG